jgi:hypothetical protein
MEKNQPGKQCGSGRLKPKVESLRLIWKIGKLEIEFLIEIQKLTGGFIKMDINFQFFKFAIFQI